MTPTAVTGSAERWGPLWGARPADWALSEDQQVPNYEAALARVGARSPARRVLDVGCGVGAFLRLVASAAARPYGIDASEALLDVARSRLPDADLRVGDMEALPYADDTFDLVTGFTSFFFANDIVAALREAGRVAKPGAAVVINVWGPHEANDLEAVKAIIRPYFPPRPADAPAEPDYSEPGVLEDDRDPGRPRAGDTRSTPRGPTCSRMRRPSGARWSRPPGSPSSSAPTARTKSRTRSSAGSRHIAPRTAATGSRTRSTP